MTIPFGYSNAGKSLGGITSEMKRERTMETIVSPNLSTPAKKALRYFAIDCKGMERVMFWTDDGQPCLTQAREYAEGLREQFGKLRLLDTYLEVEQRVNAVKVQVNAEAVNRLSDWS